MTTVVEGTHAAGDVSHVPFTTKVSRYERVSALMVSLAVILGFIAVLLFLVWLTKVFVPKAKMPKLVAVPQELKGRGDHAEGIARDMEPPGVEELPEVQEPQLADALVAMTDAVTATKGVTQAVEGNAPTTGTGSGLGDSRGVGPGGEGDLDIIPPWERWEIKFSTASVDDYASQLDFFQIELGAINRGTPNVDYARSLSAVRPIRRVGTRSQEPRVSFVHPPTGALTELSRQLLAKTGINVENCFLAQFYEKATIDLLQSIELASLGNRSLARVRKTVFGVRKGGAGFEFYVLRHEFLPGA